LKKTIFSLASYDERAALSEAGKRITRLTKDKMLSVAGQCMGIFIAFLDVRQRYDSLKAAFDVLLNQNTALLKQVKEIEELYEKAADESFYGESTKKFNDLISVLPDQVWIG
jgi:hypothetical protein